MQVREQLSTSTLCQCGLTYLARPVNFKFYVLKKADCGEWNVCPFPEPGPSAVMAAEPLPFTFETVSSWELEAWYEDLQEVLSSDEIGGTYVSSPGNEEVSENAGPRMGE